ncbi:hypothetical protein Tsubulata_015482 [Turnera subulata]|uniref:Uncharacterized protein n=1 Tax=Turnera subulata TaxID=218843 RepID=A0A9Q0FS92_9ROSI|nr:hypothetical protein Tsubulata_015482 [Turnera subulata]
MSGCKRPSSSRSGYNSIAYQKRRGGGARASFDLDDFAGGNRVSGGNSDGGIKSESKSEIVSTTEVISAVGQVWNLVNPFAVSESKGKLKYNGSKCQKDVVLPDLGGQEVGEGTMVDYDGKYFCFDVRATDQVVPVVKPEFEFVKVTQKMAMLNTLCGKDTFPREGSNSLDKSWREKGYETVGISYEREKLYGWMRRNRETDKSYISDNATVNAGSISEDANYPANGLDLRAAHCHDDSVQLKEASVVDSRKASTSIVTANSLSAAYFLSELQDIGKFGRSSGAESSSLSADYCLDSSTPPTTTYADIRNDTDKNEVTQILREDPQDFVISDRMVKKIHSAVHETPKGTLVKQEHAFAGAFAGVFVSLCLHPVDTVKTVIQSCCVDQKSISYIGRSIVSERGVTGLYRGIASKIASSAPISAIYTFTYESVKESMFPLLPKEYHAFAHCTAGGCASIATSFVFTPSERIKQQMQIGSHYQNCWSALVGIIGKGGLRSLYAGWGAVLYRNVPHSIIKFYTYETLKQLITSSQDSGAQLNTFQMLVCGGLAGSTAALCTTPFDVVKTRLQTQIPGSKSQYDSVFHALGKIAKSEGLKGLYRGLIPRLVMYMSQGALFFASYESFKRLLSMEMPLFRAQRIPHKEDMHES